MSIRVIVLCTVETGLDSISEVLRNGFEIVGLVGVHPANADPFLISGFVDVATFAKKWNITSFYVNRYDLNNDDDCRLFSTIPFDLIWVAGWQRLIPDWLINLAPLGALGSHGSPDGIERGRGRSPQNWAIMLGSYRFDVALFRITPGIDDGPIVAQRSFFYTQFDDISTSYKKASLCTAEMMLEVLTNPMMLDQSKPQTRENFFYPQRKPEDGYADWSLPSPQISAHCRSLTHPYPGMRTLIDGGPEMIIWKCQLFDDKVQDCLGSIAFVFQDDTFLVQASDGRMLVTDFAILSPNYSLSTTDFLVSKSFKSSIQRVIARHSEKFPDLPIARRLVSLVSDFSK